jgi:ribosomal protein L16 Arg81 hydroxylase
VKTGTFFDRYWNRQACYLPGNPAKFEGLFTRAAFNRVAGQCEILKVNYADSRGLPAERPIRADQIEQALSEGRSVCAGGVDAVDETLSAFLSRFRRHFLQMGRFYFNAYLSPAGKGFALHVDDHPVWILQIEGQKRWWFSERPGVDGLLSTINFPPGVPVQRLPWITIERPDESLFREVLLSPGDILYLPKGCWHRAQAVEGSLALTLAELGATPLDVIQQAILPRFRNRVEYLDSLPAVSAAINTREPMPEVLRERFETVLSGMRKQLELLTGADLYKIWSESEVREKPTGSRVK